MESERKNIKMYQKGAKYHDVPVFKTDTFHKRTMLNWSHRTSFMIQILLFIPLFFLYTSRGNSREDTFTIFTHQKHPEMPKMILGVENEQGN